MAKRESVEKVDNYRLREKYAGTPVGKVAEMAMRVMTAPLAAADKFVDGQVKTVTQKFQGR
jgi:hypothetical protein